MAGKPLSAALGAHTSSRETVVHLMRSALAAGTRRSYEPLAKDFVVFCERAGVSPVPAREGTVLAYIAEAYRAGQVRGARVRQVSAAISALHHFCGYESPVGLPRVRLAFAGWAKATMGDVRQLERDPPLPSHVFRVVAAAARDIMSAGGGRCWGFAAVVVFSFVFFARSVTAAAMRIEDVEATTERLSVTLGREKGSLTRRRLHWDRVPTPHASEGQAPHPFDLLLSWARRRQRLRHSLLFPTAYSWHLQA